MLITAPNYHWLQRSATATDFKKPTRLKQLCYKPGDIYERSLQSVESKGKPACVINILPGKHIETCSIRFLKVSMIDF